MQIVAVIVTYNGIQWVERCFSSLRNSSIPVSVIVIDNGSSDGTQKMIQSQFPEVELIQSNENLGFGKANNIGLKKGCSSGADYVFLLNQDAWIEKDTFSILLQAHSSDPSFGILSPIHLNGSGNDLDQGFYSYVNPQKCPSMLSDSMQKKQLRTIYEVEFVNAAAWMISRACLLKTGGFSSLFFHYGEDVDYVNRVKYQGFRIGICPATYIHHDRENRKPSSIISNSDKMKRITDRMKFSNPSADITVEMEIEKLKAQAKAYIRNLNLKKYHVVKQRLEELATLQKELNAILPKIKKGGPVFLD